MPKPSSTSCIPKRRLFVDEYLLDLNATQAAIRAGYSPKTAYSQGQRLLKNDEVRQLIDKAQAARAVRLQASSDWVIEELRRNHLDARKRGDIGQSNRALELLGKHLGMFMPKRPDSPFSVISVITNITKA